ncbi:MAG: molybdopterin molybdotransferase [Bacillota bacterium]|nr:molybdopterin molybdotransferase [Bacillota bacterium]
MDDFFHVRPVAAAREELFSRWQPQPLEVKRVPLTAAVGRVLAEPVRAAEDVPPYTRSTVDGYAVRAADTFGASEGLPALLDLLEDIRMGAVPQKALAPGQASRIATGGMLPAGADAVVMVEYTEELDATSFAVLRPVAPGENVIRAGEDAAAGEELLPAGARLRPADVGALAALGITTVPVGRRPRVAVLSTGDEIVPPEVTPAPGQIRDSNSYSLGAAVAAAGGEPVYLGLARDEYQAVLAGVRRGLEGADLVVLSGGSSVGVRDVAARVLAELGPPGVLVHGVALRPGKPVLIALCQGKPVFGLPGHPVSALVTFDLFVRPAIARLLRLKTRPQAGVRARLARNLASAAGREDHVRVRLVETAEGLTAEPVLGKSGLITTLVRADGTIVIPPAREGLRAGEEVEVYLL